MTFKHQSKSSPLKRIRLARGWSQLKLSVYSECCLKSIIKVERMKPADIGNVKIKTLMKLAKSLECSPVDLVPFLGATIKKKGSGS